MLFHMRLKIRCDGESWKILGFGVEVNKVLQLTDFFIRVLWALNILI